MELIHISEPTLSFGFNQCTEDPRDGLTLFGPFDKFGSYSVQAGIIGTNHTLDLYKSFVEELSRPILSNSIQRPSFPGFEAIFGIKWPKEPEYSIRIKSDNLKKCLEIKNLHERTYKAVNLYLDEIIKTQRQEDIKIDIWFVIVPKSLWLLCRPKSKSSDKDLPSIKLMKDFKKGQKTLFQRDSVLYSKYIEILDTDSDFHDQLKARLLQEKVNVPIQIVVEPTLQFRDKYFNKVYETNMKAHLAWTKSTTLFYKLGKLPWKLGDIRKGVCYLGLVFKKYESSDNRGFACSAAQMYLDSGDGTIFRGNIGPWQSKSKTEYHLDKESSKELLAMALNSYKDKMQEFPIELFVHGRAGFSQEEWAGFEEAIAEANAKTKLVGIVIQEARQKMKLFRDVVDAPCKYGILRGIGLIINDYEGYLWTRGYVPRLNTSLSLEIPNPLRIRIDKGSSEIKQVFRDIMALTKLNYNACVYGDGLPVTLKFSDKIGNILTAVEEIDNKVLPFKFYI
jgi:hypothetical protein